MSSSLGVRRLMEKKKGKNPVTPTTPPRQTLRRPISSICFNSTHRQEIETRQHDNHRSRDPCNGQAGHTFVPTIDPLSSHPKIRDHVDIKSYDTAKQNHGRFCSKISKIRSTCIFFIRPGALTTLFLNLSAAILSCFCSAFSSGVISAFGLSFLGTTEGTETKFTKCNHSGRFRPRVWLMDGHQLHVQHNSGKSRSCHGSVGIRTSSTL